MENHNQNHLTSDYDYLGSSSAAVPALRGGQTCKKSLPYEIVPPCTVDPCRTLADLTVDALRATFRERGHAPSDEMWQALAAVAVILQQMAEGDCSPAIHLSSLDPGVGKTSAVICFLQALLASKRHQHVGVVVCVGRLTQIATMVEEAGLSPSDFAILTSNKELNALGCRTPQLARILFTTHSMIEKRCQGRNFADVAALHYRGEPRQVRVWDEAILPGQTLTLSRDDLGLLLKPLRPRHPALAADIEGLFMRLGNVETGTTMLLPDLGEAHGVDLNDTLSLMQGGQPEQTHAVEMLWFLLGKHITVRRDGAYGNTMLDYRDTLPDDIKPLLVLDASARVRTVYRCWKEDRGGIKELPSATKRYDDLSIHVMQRGGGKAAFRQDGEVLVELIASTIATRPDEEWLVIGHKTGVDMDFEEAVRSLLSTKAPTVHFLHWGAHDATNDYANVPNIILAGTLFYRPSYYEALGRLASGRPSSQGAYAEGKVRSVALGEHRHLILQALCRGAVRRCIGDRCPPTRAYIIASAKSGIPEELPRIFPGARISRWKGLKRALKGKVKDALKFIVEQLAVRPTVSFREVTAHLGWKETKDFKRRIRQHHHFVEALEEEGIEEWGAGKWARGFRRKPASA